MLQFFDSHTHLNDPRLQDDLDGVLSRAREACVTQMAVVGYDLASSERALALAQAHDELHAVVGISPHVAAECTTADLQQLESLAAETGVVGIGETGLEGHYQPESLAQQQDVLQAHVELALRRSLPIVIHLREAEEQFVQWLQSREQLPLIMHCYSAGPATAKVCLEKGAYISFSGTVTFKNAAALRAVCAEVPLDRLLIETDCPYLAPGRYRGQRPCEPWMLPETASCVAEVKDVCLERIADQSRVNAKNAFKI